MSTAPNQAESSELWRLAFGQPQIDPTRLAIALEQEAMHHDLDARTRVLIRDGVDALNEHWGSERFTNWLASSRSRERLQEIRETEHAPVGFTTLSRRLMDTTRRETIEQFLRDLGSSLRQPHDVFIGGSGALILLDHLSRHTDDVDLVDEVPPPIRQDHALLDSLAARYGLRLTHFQSHYLPDGWQSRARSLGQFGHLNVSLVDPVDTFVGKLFSARTKDLDDLRHLATQLARNEIIDRLHTSAGRLLAEPQLKANAEKNWYIVFGNELPAANP